MGIETDGIVTRTEAHGPAALGVALALCLGDAGQTRECGASKRRRRGKELTPRTFGTLFVRFVSHGRRLPDRFVWAEVGYVDERLLD
jgi:hypothetical protein